jgi:hypothetical protein
LLNVNLNNFIIENTTETKILFLVPLDHRNIFQAHLKSIDLAFKQLTRKASPDSFIQKPLGRSNAYTSLRPSAHKLIIFTHLNPTTPS